jgi:hypothetical protein
MKFRSDSAVANGFRALTMNTVPPIAVNMWGDGLEHDELFGHGRDKLGGIGRGATFR